MIVAAKPLWIGTKCAPIADFLTSRADVFVGPALLLRQGEGSPSWQRRRQSGSAQPPASQGSGSPERSSMAISCSQDAGTEYLAPMPSSSAGAGADSLRALARVRTGHIRRQYGIRAGHKLLRPPSELQASASQAAGYLSLDVGGPFRPCRYAGPWPRGRPAVINQSPRQESPHAQHLADGRESQCAAAREVRQMLTNHEGAE
jgi:hypothetical protein